MEYTVSSKTTTPVFDKNNVEIKEGYFVLYKGSQKIVILVSDSKLSIHDLVISTENGISFLSSIDKNYLEVPDYQELK